MKQCFGGGTRDFCYDEARCYLNVENKSEFLNSMERSLIVKQMIDMIRAPKGGITVKVDYDQFQKIREGRALGYLHFFFLLIYFNISLFH